MAFGDRGQRARNARALQERARAKGSGLSRGKGLARPPVKARKPPPEVDPRERAAQIVFFRRLQGVHFCENCGHEWQFVPGTLEVHHVIRQQTLEDIARECGMDRIALVWDPAWGMVLCQEPAPNRCHRRHTNRTNSAVTPGGRVPGSKVPPAAFIRAEELDDALEAAGHRRRFLFELRREHP